LAGYLVARDRGAARDVAGRNGNAEFRERVDDRLADAREFVRVGDLVRGAIDRVEQVERGQVVVFARDGGERLEFVLLRLFALGRRRQRTVDDLRHRPHDFLLRQERERLLLGERGFSRGRCRRAAFRERLLQLPALAVAPLLLDFQPVGQGDFRFLASRPFFPQTARQRDHLVQRRDWMHADEQDETGRVNEQENDRRTDRAEQFPENVEADGLADPAALAGDVQPRHVEHSPPLGEAGAGDDQADAPQRALGQPQPGVHQSKAAVTEEQRRQEIRGRAEQGVSAAGHHCADFPDEIQRRPVRGCRGAERKPARDIRRRVGNEREEKQRARAEQNEAQDFVKGVGGLGLGASHEAGE